MNAPYGYTLNENYFEIAVDSDTAYQMDSVSGDVVIEAVYENHPVKGALKIVKKGEVLDGFSKDFVYKTENLSGAVFEVSAAENIYTADFQKDAEGNRILEYAAGELVGTVTTDENGEATLSNLPLGTYKIVEKTAPEGFVRNQEAQTVIFAYEGRRIRSLNRKRSLKMTARRWRYPWSNGMPRQRRKWKAQSLACMRKKILPIKQGKSLSRRTR